MSRGRAGPSVQSLLPRFILRTSGSFQIVFDNYRGGPWQGRHAGGLGRGCSESGRHCLLDRRERGGQFQTTIKKKANSGLFKLASKVVRESLRSGQGRIDPNSQGRNGLEVTAAAPEFPKPL